MCKKIVLFGLMIVFITCVSCSSPPATPPHKVTTQDVAQRLAVGFTATADILQDSYSSCATISHTPEYFDITFTSPSTLQNMTYSFSQQGLRLGYKDLTFELKQNSLPKTSVASLLCEILGSGTLKEEATPTQNKNVVAITGQCSAGEFILEVDASSLKPLKLLVEPLQLNISFIEFEFIN